jgi:uncharacterized membrane protein
MHFLDNWWHRTPRYVRLGVMFVTVVAMVLGGAADHYWQ